MQNYHNAIYREEEREMIPLLQDLGVGMIPWSPLGLGFLARPISEQTLRVTTDRYASRELVLPSFPNRLSSLASPFHHL